MIGAVATASVAALAIGALRWQAHWSELALLLVAAVLSSRLRVKLPGMASSMSGNLPIILLAVTQLGLLESLLVAAASAVAQSYDPSGKKTRPVQFVFNACTLLNAAGLAYLVYHNPIFAGHTPSHARSVVLAATTYFLANTAPVASIIGFTERVNPFALWHKVFLWSFPNYVIGAGLTAIASTFSTLNSLLTVGGLLAVLFGIYLSYKTYFGRIEQVPLKTMAAGAGR
jgi:hypothetical protein